MRRAEMGDRATMPGVIVNVDHRLGASAAQQLAELHHDWVAAGCYDAHALDSGLPDVSRLATALSTADEIVTVRCDDRIEGYGRLISWSESDGTQVYLLDVHSSPGSERSAIDEALLTTLEELTRGRARHPTTVFGANADSDDADRIRLLQSLGYSLHFEVVELELRDRLLRGTVPPGITVRTARLPDATAIAELTAANWAGRPHFGGLSAERITSWLQRNDPELFLLAEVADTLVGLAVGDIADRVVEIEDLGVHPSWRRRGLGIGLMTELLDRISNRTALPIRLLTEGDDPSGARTLYERLGFTPVLRHGRYRKPLLR